MKKNIFNKFVTQTLLTALLMSTAGSISGMEDAAKVAKDEKAKASKKAEAERKVASAQAKRAAAKKALAELPVKDASEDIQKLIKDKTKTADDISEYLRRHPGSEHKKILEDALELKTTIEKQKTRIQTHTAAQAAPKSTLGKIGSWIAKNPWKTTIGVGLGGIAVLGGVISEIMMLVGEISEEAKDLYDNLDRDWGLRAKPSETPGGGIPTPNPLPKADPNDPDYAQTLTEIAGLFSDFDKDLKEMLNKSTDYVSNVINFEAGKVNIDGADVSVSIKYDMEQLDVGKALTPVIVTLAPQDIRGFALTPNDVLGKMEDGTAKDLLTLILNPTASLIFTIKLIQLVNSETKDTTKNETAKIEYILDELTKLYSRFVLSKDEDTSPEGLLSYIQKYPAIYEVLNTKKVKMYSELATDKDTPVEEQKNAFMDVNESNLVEGKLADAIKIFYNHFYQIYFKKFPHDTGYVEISLTSDPRQTKNLLAAVFFRALKDLTRAGQELVAAEDKITLRRLNGEEYQVDPKADLENLIAKPSSGLETAANSVKDAIAGIRKIIDAAKAAQQAVKAKDMATAKGAYNKAFDSLKTASSIASNAVIEFRKKLAPFYPILWDDGTSMTPGEFLVTNIQQLVKANPNASKIMPKIYAPFKKHIGLTEAQLLGKTQDKALDTIVGKVKPLVKPTKKEASSTTEPTPA